MEMKEENVKKLVEKAKLPGKKALAWHPFYRGKIEVMPKCSITSYDDFSVWYTPGVAEPCKEIHKDPEKVFEHTNKWNYVAVISDGTRILGLGDIGPLAGFQAVKWISPTFGGINLEDIERPKCFYILERLREEPKCFYILERLREELDIPVWHDDQQGTAAVTLAGIINSLKLVGKKLNEVTITLIGAGAANICLQRRRPI